jgi:HEAT repeat protein
MNRSYLSAIISGLREKLFIPDDRLAESIKGEEQEAFEVLEKASKHEDQEIRFISAKSMLELFPARSVPVVINVLSSLTPPLRDQLIHMLLPLEPVELKEKLWEELDRGDNHLKATILYALFQLRDNKARDLVQGAINDNNSRLKSIGIYGALHFPVAELTTEACQQWKLMLDGGNVASTLAGLDILYRWPNDDFAVSLTNLLHSSDQRIKKAALKVLSVWPDNNIEELDTLIKGFLKEDDYIIRKIATNCLVKFDIEKRNVIAKEMLEDNHPDVRLSAAKILFDGNEDNDALVDWIIENKGSSRAQETMLQYVLSKNPPRQIVERLTHHLADEAINLLDAHNDLLREKIKLSEIIPAVEILDFALQERSRELIDLSLIAAGKIEDPYTIGTIRAGIKSKEKQHWAKSCEAVRYIQDTKIAASLTVVLEKLGEGKDKLIRGQQPQYAGMNALLKWLGDREDPWLNQCILQIKLSTPN